MLTTLFAIHEQVMANIPVQGKRYLYEKIRWKSKAIALLGSRGVGKTTLMCQFLLEHYKTVDQALYISADNIHVSKMGLFTIAQEYFKFGGKALFIDEAHKYPNWAQEIKNIIDTYRDHPIIFSGSSSLDLHQSKADLSRRVVYYELKGLSFREYLAFSQQLQFSVFSLETLLRSHVKLADQFKGLVILKHFREYLQHGYFPFFLEGTHDYLFKVTNVIEKVIYEDIAVIYQLKPTTLSVLKKILWLIATSHGLQPNVERISKNLEVSREIIYHCFDYLEHSGLLHNVYHHAKGMKLMRKPGKVYFENTNLLSAINGELKFEDDVGGVRETFFVNQTSQLHRVCLHGSADFILDGKYIIEVGGPSKNHHQIKSLEHAYLALDNIEIGAGKKIPLYLFGFLY